MRFVCDSCRAQYMISDEKVGAKGVKVRCKKCGFVILVRRAEAAIAAPPPDPDDGMATQVMQLPIGAPPNFDPDATSPNVHAPKAKGPLGAVGEDEIGAVFDQVLNSGTHGLPEEENGAAKPAPSTLDDDDDDDDRQSTRILDPDMVKKLALEAGASASEAAAKPTNGEEPSHDWFVAIDEKQVGPVSVEKLKDHWNRGEIGPDSLCWRAGFSDWLPLSEVAELTSVLAPRPAKPVIVAPAPAAAVVSVPIESAFSAGGVAKSVRGEMQVPLAAAPVEETSGGWKPSAASALASLAKEEIAALTRPPSKASEPAHGEDVPLPMAGGLLDLPAAEEKPAGNGKHNGAHAAPAIAERPVANPYVAPPPTYSSPGYSTYRPPSRNNLLIGLAIGGAVLVLGLITLIVYLLVRQPVYVQPPVPSQPVAVAPPVQPAQSAVTPPSVATPPAAVAAPPAAAPPTSPQQPAASPTPIKSTAQPGERPPVKSPRTISGGRDSSGGGSEIIAPPKQPDRPAPSGGRGGDEDDFCKEFGGCEKTEPSKTREPSGGGRGNSRSVYVPPAPGSGGDLPEKLNESDIFQVVLGNKPALVRCVEEQRKKEPGVSGTLMMQWTIQTNGRTSNVRVLTDEFKNSYMATCMGGLIKRWSFPKHRAQGEPVKFPFKF